MFGQSPVGNFGCTYCFVKGSFQAMVIDLCQFKKIFIKKKYNIYKKLPWPLNVCKNKHQNLEGGVGYHGYHDNYQENHDYYCYQGNLDYHMVISAIGRTGLTGLKKMTILQAF